MGLLLRIFYLQCFFYKTILTLPHNNVVLPEIKGFSPPEEVNAISSNPKDQRLENYELGKNGDEAIKEVEEIIKNNPELPRLTRGEILDILENLTKHDQEVNAENSLSNNNYKNTRDPKALMVVKAYTPLGSEQNRMEELYTKPPIITIVNDDENEQQPQAEHIIRTTTPKVTYFRKKTNPVIEQRNKLENRKNYRSTTSTTSAPSITTNKPYRRGNVQFKTTLTSTTEQSTTIRQSQTSQSTTVKDIKKRKRRPHPTSTATTTTEQASVTTYHPRINSPIRKEVKQKHTEENFINTQTSNPINYDLDDLMPQENKHEKIVPSSQNPLINDHSSIDIEVPEHLKKTFADLNLIGIDDDQQVSTTTLSPPVKYKRPLLTSTTTSNPMENAQIVAGNLPPDMQNLLKSFGLLPDPDENQNHKENEVSSFNPESPNINGDSYVGFKPLPEDSRGRKEMEDLLEQFDQWQTSRESKQLKLEDVNIDIIPEDLRPLVNEMGFRSVRKIREKPNEENTNSEMNKIGRLLDIVKTLAKKNGTITEEDIKSIDRDELKYLLASLNLSNRNNIVSLDKQAAPSPFTYDILEITKNEVKRQEDKTTTTTTTTEKPEIETSSISPTEKESEKPSIKDLEDSFGGPSADSNAESSKIPEESTTQAKPNGFYYLLDWNSFYEIDDQKGKRVNLRFQPKVGDPKRFFSVHVP